MRLIKWLCGWAVLALLYWWFVSQVQGQQLVTAAIGGAVVIAALARVASAARLSLAVRWRWVAMLIRVLPGKVLHDAVVLLAALWRALSAGTCPTGRFQERSFNPGRRDRVSAGRRALVFAAVSFAPNTFAVTTKNRDSLLVHQLVFEPEPANREWPI